MDLRIGDGLLSVPGSFVQIRRYGVTRGLLVAQVTFLLGFEELNSFTCAFRG